MKTELTGMGAAAIERALNNWAVLPLTGKIPAIPNPHSKGTDARQSCKGECGMQGHGVLDATTDIAVISQWWGGRYAGANVGCRVPDGMIVIDIDPRAGGMESLAALEKQCGKLPETLTTFSGRQDGGHHLYFRRPAGKLSARRLGRGIDLKTSSGYVVVPPSIHPDTGKPYTAHEAPVATPPTALSALLLPEVSAGGVGRPVRPRVHRMPGSTSIADEFGAAASWSDVLMPHGWSCLDADPDGDGARWVHPTATAKWSATIRNGCLFVYSSNTPFEITEAGSPKGYTKFRAYSVLEHGGDMKTAAKTLAAEAVAQ